jgi:hypothetical protein
MKKGFLILWFMLASCSPLPAWSELLLSPKQTAIALSVQQETTLLQAKQSMIDSEQAIANLKQQLSEETQKDEQNQKHDEQRISELQTKLDERQNLYEQQKAEYSKLLSSIAQSEASLKACRTEADTWRGIAIAVTVIGGIALGTKCAGWW